MPPSMRVAKRANTVEPKRPRPRAGGVQLPEFPVGSPYGRSTRSFTAGVIDELSDRRFISETATVLRPGQTCPLRLVESDRECRQPA
jgi:hypothetical protein